MTNIKSLLKILAIIAVVVIVVGYSYDRTKDFAQGPTITVLSPTDGFTSVESIVNVEGEAKNISHISMNDRQIFTNEEGLFEEKLLLYPGYNIITIKARDKFDRNIEKTLEIIYKEPKKVETVADTPAQEEDAEDSESGAEINTAEEINKLTN